MPTSGNILGPAIRALIEAEGETLTLSPGSSRIFDDMESVWFIAEGEIDLFAIQRRNGEQTGPREHLCSLPAGGMIWGIDQNPVEDGIHLLALTAGRARLSRVGTASIDAGGRNEALAILLAKAIDIWITGLSRGVTKYISPRSPPRLSIASGEQLKVAGTDRIVSHRGVTWARLSQGTGYYIDIKDVGADGSVTLVPLTSLGWLRAGGIRALSGMATEQVLHAGDISRWMNLFHEWIFYDLAYGFRDAAALEDTRLTRRAVQVAADTRTTFFRLARLLDAGLHRRPEAVGDDSLFECCAAVGKAMNITMVRPQSAQWRRTEDQAFSVADIAAASQVRTRQVTLSYRWWTAENGPLLAFRLEDSAPVALLQKSPSVTILHDPATGTEEVVTEAVAGTVSPFAQSFYAGLPDHPASIFDLVRLCLGLCRADLIAVALAGALGGIVATAIPMATGYAFDSVIPGHQTTEMLQLGAAVVVAAFAAAVFEVSRSIAQLRIEGRLSGIAQAAIMDRLLRLPTPFFADYSSGDLAQRTMVVETARKSLTGVMVGALVSGVFSVFSFALLIYYAPLAALVAAALALVMAAATLVTGVRLMGVHTRVQEVSGRISGFLLEIITGITKLRAAGAEERAFNNWGRDFSELQSGEFLARRLHNRFLVFWAAFEVVGLAAIFAVIGLAGPSDMTTGAFLAFIAAFSGLTTSLFALAKALISVFSVVPLYRRAAPILRTVPETDASRANPGPLRGDLEINSVFYRYAPDAPCVLNGLSMKIDAGELIAVVGPSGSGKSTLMRLLLGIDRPEAGAVYFDGRDLRGLNLRAVRRQIGVVMQNGRLMSGSIYENIKGTTRAGLDECWETAAKAGLADDIAAMPMGMHTLLTEGATTLSGGQVQRLLIARSLVGKPAILLLDEATSALDNKTQAVVMRSLDHLSVTRIVIAHRLSTVINADRIYVLKDGRIAESGTYQQLMENGGLFTTFAYRQNL